MEIEKILIFSLLLSLTSFSIFYYVLYTRTTNTASASKNVMEPSNKTNKFCIIDSTNIETLKMWTKLPSDNCLDLKLLKDGIELFSTCSDGRLETLYGYYYGSLHKSPIIEIKYRTGNKTNAILTLGFSNGKHDVEEFVDLPLNTSTNWKKLKINMANLTQMKYLVYVSLHALKEPMVVKYVCEEES